MIVSSFQISLITFLFTLAQNIIFVYNLCDHFEVDLSWFKKKKVIDGKPFLEIILALNLEAKN